MSTFFGFLRRKRKDHTFQKKNLKQACFLHQPFHFTTEKKKVVFDVLEIGQHSIVINTLFCRKLFTSIIYTKFTNNHTILPIIIHLPITMNKND